MTTETVAGLGRNEPCPCKSGKKYKRCCGVSAAPKLTTPVSPPAAPGNLPFDPAQMDPQMIAQFSQALQRLPKGQMQRLQSIMQKAMNGKDVTAESKEFERTLPAEFQNMLKMWTPPAMTGGAETFAPNGEALAEIPAESSVPMTEAEARALVAQAAAQGTLSKDEAQALLQPSADSSTHSPAGEGHEVEGKGNESKLGKFWRNLSGKTK